MTSNSSLDHCTTARTRTRPAQSSQNPVFARSRVPEKCCERRHSRSFCPGCARQAPHAPQPPMSTQVRRAPGVPLGCRRFRPCAEGTRVRAHPTGGFAPGRGTAATRHAEAPRCARPRPRASPCRGARAWGADARGFGQSCSADYNATPARGSVGGTNLMCGVLMSKASLIFISLCTLSMSSCTLPEA